ncbi:hypothetical protein V2J09_022177 [Rumex salicifolius]
MNTLKELIRIHDPTILLLLNNRMSGVPTDKVGNRIGFDGVLTSEAVGFKGGIWEVNRSEEDKWLFFAIYASPTPTNKEEPWNCLLNLNRNSNENKSLDERTWGSNDMRKMCKKFHDWVNEIQFIDLGYTASIKHLACNQSDHYPILLKSDGLSPRNQLNRLFFFEVMWLIHEEFLAAN